MHLIPTNQIATFDKYASCVFLPHITRQLETCTQVDVVRDRYFSDSIKAAMKEKKGNGIRMKEAGKNKIPGIKLESFFYMTKETNKSFFNLTPKNFCFSIILKENKLLLHLMLTFLPRLQP